jgi:hypothetical protein
MSNTRHMSDARSAARAAHCRHMAMETYALAELTDEPEIIGAYLDIAGQWLRLADRAESGDDGSGRKPR